MSRGRFVIIGAGIVGTAAAYRLAGAGHAVVLADEASPVAASGAAAGVISPGSVFAYGGQPPPGFEQLAVAASHAYPELLQRLAADGCAPHGYTQPGALIAATTDEEQRQLADVRAFVEARRSLGTQNIGEPELIDGDEARARHPLLGPATVAALHLPEVARVDGGELTRTLRDAAVAHGATLVSDRLVLRAGSGTVWAQGRDGTRYEADAFLVAAGSWSAEAVAEVAGPLPIAGESGEMVYCRLEGASAAVPIVMGFVHTRYVLPVGPGRFGLGATRGPARTDTAPTLGAVASILAETLRVVPALAQATVERTTVGNRPTTPDHLPVLGPADDSGRVFLACGHGSYGLMQGPYSGHVVADLMMGRTVDLDLSPYSVARFREGARFRAGGAQFRAGGAQP